MANKLDYTKKKRVVKACDSCRLKKTKCNGQQPCERCSLDDKICIYTERKKTKDKIYSSEHVELLESRLELINKSFVKLCEIIKLDDKTALDAFKENLIYNQNKDSHISINQAISLLGENSSSPIDSETDHEILFDDNKTPDLSPILNPLNSQINSQQLPFFDLLPIEDNSSNNLLSPLSAPSSDTSSMLFTLNETSSDFSMLDSYNPRRSSSTITSPSISSSNSITKLPKFSNNFTPAITLESLANDLYTTDEFVQF